MKQHGLIQSFKFTRAVPNLLSGQRPIGIGTGEFTIRPHLEQGTDSVNLEMAIDFGKTLIEYASRADYRVGPPSQLGVCLAVVPLVGEISNESLSPEQISLDKILYRFF